MNFQNILHFSPSAKKINHSVNYVVLLSSLAGVRPRRWRLANHHRQKVPVLLRPLSYKLSKECLHLISLRYHQGGMTALTSINFYRQMGKKKSTKLASNITRQYTLFILYTKPKFLVLMASSNFCLRICLEE